MKQDCAITFPHRLSAESLSALSPQWYCPPPEGIDMSDRQRDGVLRLLCIIVATIGIVFSAISIYYYYTTNQFVNNTDSAEWLFKVIFSDTASPIASASALF